MSCESNDVCPYYGTIQCLGACEFSGNPQECQELYDKLDQPLPQLPEEEPVEQPLPQLAEELDQPLPQLPQHSQPLLPQLTSDRFQFESDEKLAEFAEGLVPHSTSRSTKWALSNFNLWKSHRNSRYSNDAVPDDIFKKSDPDCLNKHLSRYVVETRAKNGKLYPPSTLHSLLCGLLRHMREINPGCPNFLDRKDFRFKILHNTLDSLFNKLHSEGIGRQTKKAEVISKDEEKHLWDSGTLNTTTPRGLLNAVFYTVGKMFCLRGGQEHRFLRLSQFKRSEEKYVYYENVSKNRNGSFKQLHVQSKVVPLYPNLEIGDRCPVYILDKYISKLPKKLKEQDIFYARPLDKVPSDADAPWYAPVPVGKHTLQSMVKKMCEEANISGCKTNHSLRATAATQMFQEGAPEKLIQERTGHRSLDGLRTYERTCETQHRALCNLLSSSSKEKEKVCQQSINNTLSLTSTNSKTTEINPPSVLQCKEISGCTININNYYYS